MSLDLLQQKQIMDLLVLSLEGEAAEEDRRQLGAILDASPEAREYYLRAVTMAECIRKMEWEAEELETADRLGSLNDDLWAALAREEKTAEAIVPERPEGDLPVRPLKAAVCPAPRKINKLSLVTLIVSSAALIFLFVLIQITPPDVRQEVATLADSLQAKWSDASIKKGQRFLTSSGDILLQEGFAQLLFDNNAQVTVEGPAKFEILSEDRIRLHYGHLYSTVPAEAIGFSVATHNALVIDLGTEFGVGVDMEGNTELHVNRGKTMLVSGEEEDKTGIEVTRGLARKVAALTSQLTEIPCDEKQFVRAINSRNRMIWRGQPQLSLADLVGGGNGWGTGQSEIGIDPLTGKRVSFRGVDREGTGDYVPLASDPYIDGVFVPDGKTPQVVSSEGHIFEECPETNNVFFAEIINGSGRQISQTIVEQPICQLGGRVYGTPDYPALFMHANLGITFDLDAIRADLPQQTIERFTADAGLSSDITRPGNAEIRVLVDGEVRFTARVNDPQQVVRIDVPLKPAERFLTVLTTDGGDEDHPDVAGERSTDSDWCIFGGPSLELDSEGRFEE